MPKSTVFSTETVRERPDGRKPALPAAARKLYLLALGAAASAIEESYALASDLMERRAEAEKQGRRVLAERQERRQRLAADSQPPASQPPASQPPASEPEATSPGLQPGLAWIDIASKADINALEEQVTRLERQVEALKL